MIQVPMTQEEYVEELKAIRARMNINRREESEEKNRVMTKFDKGVAEQNATIQNCKDNIALLYHEKCRQMDSIRNRYKELRQEIHQEECDLRRQFYAQQEKEEKTA